MMINLAARKDELFLNPISVMKIFQLLRKFWKSFIKDEPMDFDCRTLRAGDRVYNMDAIYTFSEKTKSAIGHLVRDEDQPSGFCVKWEDGDITPLDNPSRLLKIQ